MRIAIGQLWQETNTLNPCQTGIEDFEQFGVCRGEALVEQMATVNELGGFIQALRDWPQPVEILGTVRLPAWPSGTINEAAFDWLFQEMMESLERVLPVDGVLLALHGSMVADDHPDVEGEVLAAIRQRIGPEVPLVATLDLHANITPAMVEATDGLVLYHCMPHVDIQNTGRRGAEFLRSILFEDARPMTAYQRVPAVLPAEWSDTEAAGGPAARRKARLLEWEAAPAVMTAGVSVVQPWMDIPQLGSSVIVTTDGDGQLAGSICRELADELWSTRREYLPSLVSASEAVAECHQAAHQLNVLSDAADATTSGAAGDSVWILAELLKFDWPRPALCTVVAADVVEAAFAGGEGRSLKVTLGGRRDTRFGTQVTFEATVQKLFRARFTMTGHIGTNMPIDMGRAVLLARDNVWTIVTERTGPHFAKELFETAGVDPFQASVLVAKSPCGFRAVYEQRAGQVLCVQAPGCAPSDFWNYEFRNIPRPLWPWDEIEAFTPAPEIRERGA